MRMKVRMAGRRRTELFIDDVTVDNKMLNGLDDDSELMEKGRPTSNEVDWSHVPTKRKKPAKKKVRLLQQSFLNHDVRSGQERPASPVTHSNTATATARSAIKTSGPIG